MSKVNELLKQAGVNFLGGIIQAKQDGEQLPKAFDAIATLAINGQDQAIILAQDEVKKQAADKMTWFIIVILALVIVFLLIKEK